MYSLVMLVAMSSGQDPTPVQSPAPQPAVTAPVTGCYGTVLVGCTGCYGSCTGCCGSCSGCYGSCTGCYGSCHGGLFHGGGLFGHHKASCQGCTGYNCNGWNCFGSCSGSSCHGSCCGSSCFGSCSGSSSFSGCYGFGTLQSTPWQCHGGGYNGYYGGGAYWGPGVGLMPAGVAQPWGYGPRGIYSDPYAVYGTINQPPIVVIPAETKPGETKPMEKPVAPPPTEKPKEGMGANLKFRLPADAKLYVDGRLTVLSGTERAFNTPPLTAGKKYFYDVRAELMVDGKPVIEERRVIVEAGADLTESFAKLFAAAEGKAVPVAER
jgi:uncharacterized protein (TIGR03000 family)